MAALPTRTRRDFVVEPYFIVELRHLGVHFNVTAVGAQSNMQADVKFTDAGNITYSPATAPVNDYRWE